MLSVVKKSRDKLSSLLLGPLDMENAWWLLPLGLGLWMAPYLGVGSRFTHLWVMLAALTLGLALRRLGWMRLLLHCLWGAAALAALGAIWQKNGWRGLGGTILFLGSLTALGKITDHLLLKTSAVGELSRANVFLRLPYLLSLGLLVGTAFFSFAGLAIPISWLFIMLPIVCLPWGLYLTWRERPWPRLTRARVPGRDASAAVALLIMVPLLLVGLKAAMFYKFDYGAHGEIYSTMIWSIAHQDNFPVTCPDPLGRGEVAAPLDNLRFDLNKMCKFLHYYGQKGKDLWPSHFSGETLAAFWHKWAGIHPHDAFRWTQFITSFCLFAWATLMVAPLLGGLSGGVLWASVLCVRFNEWCYIDLDLCTMGLLGSLWLVGIFSGQEPGRIGRKGMIFFLTILLGAVLYTSYPGTVLIFFPILFLALLWHWWRG